MSTRIEESRDPNVSLGETGAKARCRSFGTASTIPLKSEINDDPPSMSVMIMRPSGIEHSVAMVSTC